MKKTRTHPMPIVLFVVLALFPWTSASAHDHLQRGGVDQVSTNLQLSRFSLDLTVGLASLDGIDEFRGALAVTPRFVLGRSGGQAFALTLPWLWIPGERTFFTRTAFADGELAYTKGASVVFAPSIEWYFCPDVCLRPSMFIGAGVRHDERSSPFLELDDQTSAVLTLGSAVERPITKKLALRFEIRALATFYQGERSPVGAPDGLSPSIIASVGLKLRPGQ